MSPVYSVNYLPGSDPESPSPDLREREGPCANSTGRVRATAVEAGTFDFADGKLVTATVVKAGA